MTTLERIAAFLSNPAPGVVFSALAEANLPRRAHPTRHEAPMSPGRPEFGLLLELAGAEQDAHRDLILLYERYNGLRFCLLRAPDSGEDVPALHLLPVADWDDATAPWLGEGEMAYFMEGCEMYRHGTWRVIARMPSEGMCLVYFFDGEHEGQSLAGRMFCIGLDGYLGFEEVLAESFGDFVAEFTDSPATFLQRIGFDWVVRAGDSYYGAEMEDYVPDVRDHPDLMDWPQLASGQTPGPSYS